MIKFFISIIFAAFITLAAYIFYPIHLISGRTAGYKYIIRPFFKLILKINGVNVNVAGIENVDVNSNYLIVANHQSVFDVIIISAFLPLDIRIITKKEMLLIPFFGWILPLYDYIMVNRKNSRESVKSISQATKMLKKRSLLIFPEGTRSADKKVGKFKSAGVVMACDAKVRILPVALQNVSEIMKKNEFSIHSGKVSMTILKPVEIKDKSERKEIIFLIENNIRKLVE